MLTNRKKQCYNVNPPPEKVVWKIFKIFLKSAWRRGNSMIWYQSCVWTRQNQEPWQINSNATLKIQMSKVREDAALKKIQKQVSNRNEPKNSVKEKPEGLIWPEENFLLRVWSWLRMNAGGVLNTCKSNGVMKRAGSACTEQSFHNLVADGWVTRG